MSFLTSGIYTNGCIIPVTTEDPELVVKETNPESKRWGIAFFLGSQCIGLINDETDRGTLHRSILTCSVYRNGKYVGSVANRLS
jgi:hypothetical protein